MAHVFRVWHDPGMVDKRKPPRQQQKPRQQAGFARAAAAPPEREPPTQPERAPTFLRQWRKFRRLSQEAACEHFAITQPTLSKTENGELPYNQDFMEQAARIYGCTVAALLTVDPTIKDPLPRAWSELEDSPPEVRRQVANVIAAMLRPPS